MTRFSGNEVISSRKSRSRRGGNGNRKKIMKSKKTNTDKTVLEDIYDNNEQVSSRTKAKLHRKRMYKCCVPQCFTYGPKENFIPFPPFDSQERQTWVNKIPRRNWVVCHDTVICKNHFTQNDIHKDPIVPERAPSLFPDLPILSNPENKYKKIDPWMLDTSPSYALPETFGDLEELPNFEDFIFEFFTLRSNYTSKVADQIKACHWLTQDTPEYVLFYQLDVLNFAPSISISILINEQMKVVVALEGVVMDPLDYTRHVPINGRITHWIQVRNMLCDFGWERRMRQKIQEKLLVPVNVCANISSKDTTKNFLA